MLRMFDQSESTFKVEEIIRSETEKTTSIFDGNDKNNPKLLNFSYEVMQPLDDEQLFGRLPAKTCFSIGKEQVGIEFLIYLPQQTFKVKFSYPSTKPGSLTFDDDFPKIERIYAEKIKTIDKRTTIERFLVRVKRINDVIERKTRQFILNVNGESLTIYLNKYVDQVENIRDFLKLYHQATKSLERDFEIPGFTFEMVENVNLSYRKRELIDLLKSWNEYYEVNGNGKRYRDMQLAIDWSGICNDFLSRISGNGPTQYACFILYKNQEIQGLALCGIKNLNSRGLQKDNSGQLTYHIFDMLTAPWNILPRCLEVDKKKLVRAGVGTTLLSAIVAHAKSNAKLACITVVPGSIRSEVREFYKRRMFEGYDNMEMSRKKFTKFLIQYLPPKDNSLGQHRNLMQMK